MCGGPQAPGPGEAGPAERWGGEGRGGEGEGEASRSREASHASRRACYFVVIDRLLTD